jgi:hypothetical protein
MTSQVAVFNQLGIAVASDTILTVTRRSGARRTYENRSKLVELGKDHKVLVATHGNAVVNDVDISIVLREWSRSLEEPLDTLQDYVDGFKSWYSSSNDLFTEESETDLAEHILREGFAWMERWVRGIRGGSESKRSIAESPLSGLASNLLDQYRGLSELDGFTDNDANDYLRTSSVDVTGIITDTFGSPWEHMQEDLSAALPLLWEMAPLMLSRIDHTLSNAGLAFVGYGSSDHFPSTIEINMHGKIGQESLLWTEGVEQEHPAIVSFAQDDAVQGFIFGASDQAVNVIVQALTDVMAGAIESGQLDPNVGVEIRNKWQDLIWERLFTEFKRPLNSTVSSLALYDLARLAESLVGIEALRANASPNPPGVGGMVEAATIDRYDGVQWVRRLTPPNSK